MIPEMVSFPQEIVEQFFVQIRKCQYLEQAGRRKGSMEPKNQ
jgi:hypothetical protein